MNIKMKKFLLILTVAFSSVTFAQKGIQEISLDVGDAIGMKSLELTYEYNILKNSSLGLSGFINFAKGGFKYNEKTMFTPFFRHYISADKNWKYFGEVFFGINTGERNENEYTDLALGVSGGLKYISNDGIAISGFAGAGRNMFSKNSFAVVPRVGITVGYRF